MFSTMGLDETQDVVVHFIGGVHLNGHVDFVNCQEQFLSFS